MNFFQFAQSQKKSEKNGNPFEKMLGAPIQTPKIAPPLIKVPELTISSITKPLETKAPTSSITEAPALSHPAIPVQESLPFGSSFQNNTKFAKPSSKKTPTSPNNIDEQLAELDAYFRDAEVWAQENSTQLNQLLRVLEEWNDKIDLLYNEVAAAQAEF